MSGGDCHLYLNHLEQARLQLRDPAPSADLIIKSRPTNDFRLRYSRIFRSKATRPTRIHQGRKVSAD